MAKTYVVKQDEDGNWRVELRGSRAVKVTEKKSDARSRAKEVAQNQNAHLLIYTSDGNLQNEYDYTK